MGTLFKRPDSRFWQYQYSDAEGQHIIPTKEINKKDAIEFQKNFEDQLKRNRGIQRPDKLVLKDAVTALIDDYDMNNKSTSRAQISCNHITDFFDEKKRLIEISTDAIERYKKHRFKKGAKNSTINRELAALKRGMNLLKKTNRISYVPAFIMLKEKNVRQGFMEHWEYLALMRNLPEYLQPVLEFLYRVPWRKEEALSLEWRHVDLHNNEITIPVGETKNGEGRIAYLYGDLQTLFNRLWNEKVANNIDSPYVFLGHKKKNRIKDCRYAWKSAVKDAKLEKKYMYDTRRTACRNAIRAGIPESVVMKMGGWKTRAMLDRYNISSRRDLQLAPKYVEEYLKKQPTEKPEPVATKGLIEGVVFKVGDTYLAKDGGEINIIATESNYKGMIPPEPLSPEEEANARALPEQE
jgi:integrase